MEEKPLPVDQLLKELPRLRGLARALVGEALADDLTQEAMRVALERGPSAPVSPAAWLNGIARNLARGGWRTERRRRGREQKAARPEAVESAPEVERSEAIALLGRALASLPEAERALLMARFFDRVAPRRMAQEQGVPVATLRSRLSRALAHLRKRMAELGGTAESLHGIAALAALPKGLAGLGLAEQAANGGGMSTPAIAATAATVGVLAIVGWQAQRPEVAQEPAYFSRLVGAGAQSPEAGELVSLPAQEPVRTDVAPFSVEVIRVDDAGISQPVADVEVWWLAAERLEGLAGRAALMRQGRIPAEFLDDAAVARTGSTGRADFLTAPAGPYFLWAEGPAVAGFDGPLQASSSAQLELEPARWMQVDVLNHAGTPAAGVTLSLGTVGKRGLLSTSADLRTDTRGVARVPLGLPEATDGPSLQQKLEVAVNVLGGDPVTAPAGTLATPVAGVQLRLPPAGGLHLRLPPDGPQSGFLILTCSGSAGGMSIHAVEQGELLLPCVALGVEFELTLTLDQEGGVREKRIEGPVDPGQIVEVYIAEDEGVFLSGQVLNVDGSVLRPRKPWLGEAEPVILVIEGWGIDEVELQLDEDGRFRHGLGLLQPKVEDELRIRVRYRGQEAVLDSVLLPEPGVNDLGALQLGVGPLLVAGSVVDANARPIAGLEVRVEYAVDQGGPRPVWVLDSVLRSETDLEGRFEYRCPPREDRYRIRVDDPEWVLAEPAEFVHGAQDLRVRLARAGAVEADWQLPEGAPQGSVRAALVPASLTDRNRMTWSWVPEQKHRWEGVEAGTYRLEFIVDGAMTPCHVIDGLHVPLGGDCADPRLRAIDLRSKLRLAELEVEGANSQSLEHIFVRRADDVFARELTSDRDGNILRFLLPRDEESTLVVGGSGCAEVVVSAAVGLQRVALPLPQTMRFSASLREVAGPEFQLKLGVRLPKADPLASTIYHRLRPKLFDAEGQVEHVVPVGRPILLQWQLYRREGDSWQYVRERLVEFTPDGSDHSVRPPQGLFADD